MVGRRIGEDVEQDWASFDSLKVLLVVAFFHVGVSIAVDRFKLETEWPDWVLLLSAILSVHSHIFDAHMTDKVSSLGNFLALSLLFTHIVHEFNLGSVAILQEIVVLRWVKAYKGDDICGIHAIAKEF